MKKIIRYASLTCVVSGMLAAFPSLPSAESLNPEGTNPHAEAPRKKITHEQKRAAWEAKKKKMKEIENRRQTGETQPSGTVSVESRPQNDARNNASEKQ